MLRCLWETCCQKSNPNCSPGVERYCLSQFPTLASRISEVCPTALERPLHNQKGNAIGRYIFHGYECECHLPRTHFPVLISRVLTVFLCLVFACMQQLLCSTISCFWGIGIGCMIEYFGNDVDKLVNAFYPIFKKWVQLDYHNLKKLSDLSISIRR